MLPSALSVSPLSLVTRCIMGSVFSDYREGAAIFRAVSAPEDGGCTKFAWRSRLMLEIRSAIRQEEPWPSATSLGSPSRCVLVSSPPLCSSVCSMASLLKPPPSALGADWRRRAGRRPPRSPTGGARAPRASSPRQPPPASLSSWLPGRLSSARGASGPNASRRDLVHDQETFWAMDRGVL